MVDIDKIPRPLLVALLDAAQEVSGAPRTGIKRIDAEAKLGRVLVAINGAPLMFKGLLRPDCEPYPLPGVDSYVTAALEEFGASEADPLDAQAETAVVRCVDSMGNTAFIRHTPVRGWSCVLDRGTPASMSYAGVPHGEEVATQTALSRAKTVRDVLRIVKARAERARSVELEA